MFCTLLTRLFGLVRNGVINAILGGGGHADVWHFVFMIPNNLRKLFAEGALSSAFIPVLSSSIVKDPSGANSKKIVRNIFTFQLIILVPIVILAIIFARPLINMLANFPEEDKIELSITLFRYIFSYIIFISISAILMGVLNSNNIFIPPALTPLLFSISVITSVLVFYKYLHIYSLAPGIILGGIAQVVFQLPFFLKKGYDFKPDILFNNEYFTEIIKLWIPILAASSIFTINQQVAMILASGLEDGSTSAIGNALVFFQLPFGMITASITTVLFPKMSKQVALDDKAGLISSFSYGLNFIIIFLIPAAIGYIFFGKEIISFTFERGAFTANHTMMAYNVLCGYSIGLFSLGAFIFCQRLFYSFKEFKTPLIISLFIVVIDILLSLWLKETQLRVTGLAIANSVAFSLGFLVLLFFVRKKLGRIGAKRMLINFFKVMLSMCVLVTLLVLYKKGTASFWTSGSSIINGFLVIIAVVISLGITFFMYFITKIDIFRMIYKERFLKK